MTYFPAHLPDGPALRVCVRRPRLPQAAALALAMMLAAGELHAGDILRGGTALGSAPGKAGPNVGNVAAEIARVNARDALTRTTQALNSVKAMQVAARAAAVSGANHLGLNPNKVGSALPNVPNGLVSGGLKVAGEAPWRGAGRPVQATIGGRTVVTIGQKKQQALLTWKTFNVGKNTTVNFDQSAGGETRSTWIAVNKITDPSGSPSQILGSLEADGQVFLINPNGILFGGSSQVNLHSLVASSLPVNDGLLARGILNNPDGHFLFSALPIEAGAKGTPAFAPVAPTTEDGENGDVIVQAGASIVSPTSGANVGGRVMLIGPTVRNEGAISVPDGQAILAAGLQVGVTAHASSDPNVRGLDVFVGEVKYPPPPVCHITTPVVITGSATNAGLIDAPRANVTIAGRTVNQLGVISSTTSVTLNGSVNLLAQYGARAFLPDPKEPAVFSATENGVVNTGASSVLEILPELSSAKTVTGTKLPLRSQVVIEGRAIHFGENSTLLAPNADVTVRAGARLPLGSAAYSTVFSAGQIYVDAGALLNVAGTTDVVVPISQNILSLELRGAELADSPLQRTGPLRAVTLNLDIRQSGTFAGREWVGTPLGDARGFVGLIERGVAELTTAGGTVKLNAGQSVVMQAGSKIDVSGGWVQFEGGMVQTTRVISGGQIMDIAQATPDRVFQGLYDGTFTVSHPKYALSETFTNPLQLSNERHEEGYVAGKSGGAISITAASMALDGELLGHTVSGPRQRTPQTRPAASALALNFEAADAKIDNYPLYSPTPPGIAFYSGAALPKVAAFSANGKGNTAALGVKRLEQVALSPDLFAESGFGSIAINNPNGGVEVPAGTTIRAPELGSLTIRAANLDIQGRIVARGGSLNFSVYDAAPYDNFPAGTTRTIPAIDEGRGNFTLGAGASLNVAGLIVDDRPLSSAPLTRPLVLDGGSVAIASFSADLQPGSAIDASGGVALSTTGRRTFGNGGSIAIRAGQDPAFAPLIGGTLELGARLSALSGAKAGSLTILAPAVQIGGARINKNTLILTPEFFSEGGFGTFALTGLGKPIKSRPGEYVPGVRVAHGTIVRPIAKSWDALPYGPDGGGLRLVETTLPQSQRTPVSISLAAPGVRGLTSSELLVRGSILFGKGASIQTDPRGSFALSGEFVTMNGELVAPGGTITIKGESDSTKIEGGTQHSLTTVFLGSHTFLSTAGTTLLTPNAFGYRTGSVLPGGKISVTGNIVAEEFARLDVSGASATLDLPVASVTMGGTIAGASVIPMTSGVNAPLYATTYAPMQLDSDAGEIVLAGGDHLFSDATLRGVAGGPSGLGGALTVSSGRFFVNAEERDVLDVTLRVTQAGRTLPANLAKKNGTAVGLGVREKHGTFLDGFGRFVADRFPLGGFDALTLRGTVGFRRDVSIEARRTIAIADGGVILGQDAITLRAPHVTLGTRFLPPLNAEQVTDPFFRGAAPFNFDPTFGPGKLTVTARLIDLGNLSLQGIGRANFFAEGGDLRGDGTLDVAGRIRIRAGQVYPPSAVTFNIAASDYTIGEETHAGSVLIESGGARQLPLSAGGQLNIHASLIRQAGTLRAPLGGITLGWDGTGAAPRDPITGKDFAIAQRITLAAGSVTSVSAVDPVDGSAMLLPYGLNVNGVQWIDPAGRDITAGGVVQKTITIAGAKVRSETGSTIDLRGGGDLYSFRWVPGIGGSVDVLATSTSFAVVPGYAPDYAPFAPFNPVPPEEGAALSRTPGYVNDTLRVGDRIFLGKSDGLAEGLYTVLPARYALLPGGHLITPGSGAPIGSLEKPDGTALVPGYRFNDLNSARTVHSPLSWFEVLGPADVRARSEFKEYSGNTFLLERAIALETKEPRLPADAGHLILQALNAITLRGDVAARGASSAHHGGLVDLASAEGMVIGAGGLDPARLNGFGAESLLLGGTRQSGTEGTAVTVKTGSVVVDNAGAPLRGPEIILAANEEMRIAPGASIQQTGRIVGGKGDTLLLSGDGTLLRVTSDPKARLVRSDLAGAQVPRMTIGAGALIAGTGVTLDSTFGTALDPNAHITGDSIAFSSGQISILINHDCELRTDGLVLSGAVLDGLASSKQLSLLSYSTLDLYGAGAFTTNGSLALHAAQIRGRATGGGTVTISARELLLDNSAKAAATGEPIEPKGALVLVAETIAIGRHQLAIESYADVELNAARGITLTNNGGLSVQKNLTANTPFLTAAQSATQTIKAGGNLSLLAPAGSTASAAGGLGASITIEGAMVTVSSDIVLPSGALTLHSTTCDVTIDGRLNLDGTQRTFYDLVRRTPGGQITIMSDSGSVKIGAGSVISASAPAGGGDAGTLRISAPNGGFESAGRFSGRAGAGGLAGTFSLDTGNLDDFAALETTLAEGGFTQSQSFRIRSGDVQLEGAVAAHQFRLSTDLGAITVGGTIDASGARGGAISLIAAGGVTLLENARLTVAGRDFDAAGKGGAITLETRGLDGGTIDLRAGSLLDLGVGKADAASASNGQFTGTLHLRAPQNADATDLAVAPLGGTISGASSIVVEGYKTFDFTGEDQIINAAAQKDVLENGKAFLGENGKAGEGYAAMLARVLGVNTKLESVLSLRPGAEITNSEGNLTLGASGSKDTADWNLATFRFGPKGAPGLLTLRAAGDIVLFNSISDGFATGKYTAELLAPNAALPLNAQSWSYRLTAGADFTAADGTRVVPLTGLGELGGSLLLGKNGGTNVAPPNIPGGQSATGAAIGNKFQTIRTGSGDIDINAARDVQLLNPFATIYTAGTLIADPTKLHCAGAFELPVRRVTQSVDGVLGPGQQIPFYAVQYTFGGGNVNINAGADIAHFTKSTTGEFVADSQRELPINWLNRRGNIDPLTGEFGVALYGDVASTTWWVDFSNFFESVGALGGGNVSLTAGRDIANVDAVAPTNGRMAGGVPDLSTLLELGGGDVTIRSGRNIDGGVYYVERGRGTLTAGGEITTNSTRSPSPGIIRGEDDVLDARNWLPTTLFAGKASFDVTARGDLLLGPVVNPFLVPGGINNGYWYKTYFSTYAPTNVVNVTSLGSDITLRNGITLPGETDSVPMLFAWFKNELLFKPGSGATASFYQPWLRLNESSIAPFSTAMTLMPSTLRATAFGGDVNVVGTINLSPSPNGTAEIVAARAINGLNITGTTFDGVGEKVIAWGAGQINVSDASPAGVPGVGSPFGYQGLFGTGIGTATTNETFFAAVDALFSESGSTRALLQQKQALHAAGILHKNDPEPLRIYAGTGDLSGLTVFSPKAARIFAGHDISDVAIYVQNTNAGDISVVTAGRDLIAYSANSPLRTLAAEPGNVVNFSSLPLAGDLQISGPGTLEVLAGRDLDLGVGPAGNGIALGVVSVGNARNPFLPFGGADIVAGAGIGPATGLEKSPLNFKKFLTGFLAVEGNKERYADELARLGGDFDALTSAQRSLAALELFYIALRDAGRDHADEARPGFGNYAGGFAAITALFGEGETRGDISLTAREFKTQSGGNISLLAPGGKVVVGLDVAGTQALDQGILTESGGSIFIFANGDVSLGTSRIFTLRGGDEIIWSSQGDIAAGVASKTVQSAPPTRVLIDPQTADLKTDLAGLATGGGIGVLATVEGIPPGNVDLIAPNGAIDAGDAGIRSAGNLNIAATQVLNAENIQVSGSSSGTPTSAPVAAPNLGSISAASNTAGAASTTASDAAKQATQQTTQPQPAEEPPSLFTVEVLGYGGGDGASAP